jgi:hypothetical protein
MNRARPGTCRSNVGCDAIDEPWTNRIVPFASRGSTALFRHRNSRTSPLRVQCSVPCNLASLIILTSITQTFAPGDSNQPLRTNFPCITRSGKERCASVLPHSMIFFVSQRFDQPLCRCPPAGKGRDDDAGTTGGEIALESAPDVSTVTRGNERSRQRLAYRILSTIDFAAPRAIQFLKSKRQSFRP